VAPITSLRMLSRTICVHLIKLGRISGRELRRVQRQEERRIAEAQQRGKMTRGWARRRTGRTKLFTLPPTISFNLPSTMMRASSLKN
jgi:hypothetical protein